MNNIRYASCLCACLFYSELVISNTLTFLGLRDNNWFVYSLNEGQHNSIPKLLFDYENPRSFSRLPEKGYLAYIDQYGLLQLYDESSKKQKPLQPTDSKDRFTQLRFSEDGRLWAVKLPGGTSRQTQLVEIDVVKNITKTHVAKRGSQFDPFWYENFLYFTSAHCVDDCDPMIWELWRRDGRTGKQQQLTLGGAVSREPVLLGDSLYFSSNRSGYYHLWKMKSEVGAKAEPVTNGDVLDNFLAPAQDGTLFFVRKTQDQTKIMHRNADGIIETVQLPDWLLDIRELEVHH